VRPRERRHGAAMEVTVSAKAGEARVHVTVAWQNGSNCGVAVLVASEYWRKTQPLLPAPDSGMDADGVGPDR